MAKKRVASAVASATCGECGKRHRTLTEEQCEDRRMTEATLQQRVIGRAKRRGWEVAHAGKGWVGDAETGEGQFVTPMAPGWPDLMLFNPRAKIRAIAMELKREQGEVSDEQWKWLELLNNCGIPAVIVRPSDLRSGRVNVILDGV